MQLENTLSSTIRNGDAVGTDQSRFEEGLAIRKEVLGGEHVQRSLDNATPFAQPMQELVTELAWGTIWSRPGLSRQTRSLLNIAMLSALAHHDELRAHVRGALTNGCTVEEIQETVLQASVYAGMPAGLAAFRIADAVITEHLQA